MSKGTYTCTKRDVCAEFFALTSCRMILCIFLRYERYVKKRQTHTARCLEDETRNGGEIQIEILNGGEILINYKFKFNKNLCLNLYREIPRNSNPIKIKIRRCTMRYRENVIF